MDAVIVILLAVGNAALAAMLVILIGTMMGGDRRGPR